MNLEETLDPDDWEETRKIGHAILDDMIDFLSNVRNCPVWKAIPEQTKRFFQSPVPKVGENLNQIYNEIRKNFLPFPMGCFHPRFWGWVRSNGIPTTLLAEIITAALNSNTGGGEHATIYLEKQVLDWIKEILGYPKESSGLLVSGCSMANFIGLATARNSKAGYNIIEKGIKASEKKLMFYGSVEMHSSIDKAMQLLGLGYDSLRKIPVNERFEIEIDILRKTIKEDIEKGYKPICIIANVGTINTGAVDDVSSLANLAEEYDLWLHVDGAFGVWSKISSSLAHLTVGLEGADSIAFDLHKWMYFQYEAGCVLVKNKKEHHEAFSLIPDYLEHKQRGLAGGEFWPEEYGVQLTRKDRALKIWMGIKEHGLEKFGRLVEQNIQQAKYLTDLIKQEPKLEVLAPTSMNVINFRFNDGQRNADALDRLNDEIILRLQEKGEVMVGGTKIKGKVSIRVAIVNHRSKKKDFNFLVTKIIETAEEIIKSL
ncbi:MAG: pyridoxal phosphate-dependent decarboxylase family protein [Candidatus Heimdallarchaeaceae archaeon]